ncbi:MAG: V-type ATPase 116kDa subunit family protein [Planctomycetota bacterium]
MIVPMSRIEIVGPKEMMERAAEALQAEGAVHLEQVPLIAEGYRSFLHRVHLPKDRHKEREFLRKLLEHLNDVVAFIPTSIKARTDEIARCVDELSKLPLEEVFAEARALERKITSLIRRRNNIQDDLETVSHYRSIFQALIPLFPENVDGNGRDLLATYEFVGIILERRHEEVIELLRRELDEISDGNYELHTSKLSGERVCGIVMCGKEHAGKVRDLIWAEGVNELAMPKEFKDRPLWESLEALRHQAEELPQRLRDLREELKAEIQENGARILAMRRICLDRLSRWDAIGSFAVSKFTFAIDAWAPTDLVAGIRTRLAEKVSGSIVVHEIHQPDLDPKEVPVKLDNPRWARPFELLLSLFPSPTYGTIDPTIFITIAFPLFYGFILGDIGYGLLVIVLAAWLGKRYRHVEIARAVCWIAGCCGAAAIVFGIVFGELFGSLGLEMGVLPSFLPLWAERTDVMDKLLVIAIVAGIVHVSLGLILGMIHSLRQGDRRHFAEKVGLFLGLLAFIFLAEAHFERFLSSHAAGYVSVILFAVSIAVIGTSVGVIGAVEIITVASNILSYSRLMAIGIASIVLAEVANECAHATNNLLLGILVGGIIHLLNLAMGVFSPAIQSLRLQYVEFLPKFYHTEGRDYDPFGRR